MKETQLEKDVKQFLRFMKLDYTGYSINYFEGERKDALFNAYYNKEYTYSVDEYTTKTIEDVLARGQKMFGVKVLFSTCRKKFDVFKESKSKSIWMHFDLVEQR